MKLRNKKTGEIVYATMMASYGGGELQIRYYPIDRAEDTHFKEYRSIADLNEDWEDYKEPKVFYYITGDGYVVKDNDSITKDFADDLESIGNCFETEEEAEKAVEKLKAWKRLKDKGVKITGWETLCGDVCITTNLDILDVSTRESAILDLLFGGEE